MEAHAVVRKFLDDKISKGQGEKRKLMMSLDCLIEAAKYENEMIKSFALILSKLAIKPAVPGIDSNLRIKSTSHCVFSDATKLNLMEGVFEK
ncbi:hypothetical protein Avbf_12982 [Armadillidium vulgare]|nr:hypothetical protein Avbf_12982 [Armadillidium vulgare]